MAIIVTALLYGCGGGGSGGGTTSVNSLPTSAQVSAISAAQIATYSDSQIAALDANIQYLSNAALNALSPLKSANNPAGQIETITPSEISVLTPAQIRMIGAASGGSITTSQIRYLNSATWSQLATDPAQVAAITAAEIATLPDAEIIGLGTHISALGNTSLNALSPLRNLTTNLTGQIESITSAQIAALTPEQIQMIGSGSGSTPPIQDESAKAWATLASDPAKVAAITAAEIAKLTDSEIAALGTNINALGDAALGALSPMVNLTTNLNGQIESITASQVTALTPAEIAIIAGINAPRGASTAIAYLNANAFGSLNALQTAVLMPVNVMGVSAAQLASLTPAALSGLSPATESSLTVTQKSQLSSAQHSACGC